MILYSRPKLFDLYTPSQSKLLENHSLHSGTHLYSPNMTVPPPPELKPNVFQFMWMGPRINLLADRHLMYGTPNLLAIMIFFKKDPEHFFYRIRSKYLIEPILTVVFSVKQPKGVSVFPSSSYTISVLNLRNLESPIILFFKSELYRTVLSVPVHLK